MQYKENLKNRVKSKKIRFPKFQIKKIRNQTKVKNSIKYLIECQNRKKNI